MFGGDPRVIKQERIEGIGTMNTRTRRQIAAALIAGGFALVVPAVASAATDPAPTPPPGMMTGSWDADEMLEWMQSPQHDAFMNSPGHTKFMSSQGHDEFMNSPAHEQIMGDMTCPGHAG